MADGSKGDAPSASGDVADNRLPSSVKHCTVCKVPVTNHACPHGPSKCLLCLLTALRERVDCLEVEAARRDVDFREQEKLHLQRQEGLLATIECLESRVQRLECDTCSLKHALASAEAVVTVFAFVNYGVRGFRENVRLLTPHGWHLLL